MRKAILVGMLGLYAWTGAAQGLAPAHLRTDLLEHTDRIYMGGYPTPYTLATQPRTIESYQLAHIHSAHPRLSWQLQSQVPNTLQTAYRILVASKPELLLEGKADIWDSGRIEGDAEVSVPMQGPGLEADKTYCWSVKTWDNHGTESTYAPACFFHTAKQLDNEYPRYPLQKQNDVPVRLTQVSPGVQVCDFGKAAYGQLQLSLTSHTGRDTVVVHLGEAISGGRVNRKPGGTIRYSQYTLPLLQGTHTYHVKIRPDGRNTDARANESGVKPILMPEYIGEVTPFRYCEIENYPQELHQGDVIRPSVHYMFNQEASSFHSSDTVLNQVWDLCKYTICGTSFSGVYVDGDRERIPYEADALINQLGHYGVDSEYSMARYSIDYLMQYPTWPTEWILQTALMVWDEYLYTADTQLMKRHYDMLKAKTLLALRQPNGLISTKLTPQTPEFLRSIGYRGKSIRDIVDWPQSGAFGVGKKEAGEADGYKLGEYNTVVNAYHYRNLRLISQMAHLLGKTEDEQQYAREADRVLKQFNTLLFNAQEGCYMDGLDTDHASLHANMFPVAFDMVSPGQLPRVLEFMRSRGMACSVYGAQFLLDALYQAGDADYALSLMNATTERSWYNMIRIGSTMGLEAWDARFKNNLDWNHAWGAAPANVIPRKLMGVEPAEPGFRTIRIKPQPGSLAQAEALIPTIRGGVKVSFQNQPGQPFQLQVEIPANTQAEVYLPLRNKKGQIQMDGTQVKGTIQGKFVKVKVGSGHHTFIAS